VATDNAELGESVPEPETVSDPVVTTVSPVYVLVPLKVNVPLPAFTRLPIPPSVPLNVLEYALLVPTVKITAAPLSFFKARDPLPDNPARV
jgi:hypothetical protein